MTGCPHTPSTGENPVLCLLSQPPLSRVPGLSNKLKGHPHHRDLGEGVSGCVQRGRNSSRPQGILMGQALKLLELLSKALWEGSFVRMQKSQGCLGRSVHLGLRGMLG